MRILRFLIIISCICIIASITYLGLTGWDSLKDENTDKIASIYSNDDFTKTMYSGNTEEKAQHLIEITNNSWKQGCERDDECFLPYVTAINVGDIILFANQDEYEHNIRVRGDSEYLHFPADVIKPNEYFVYKFLEYGKYDYYCTLHPWMEGVIQVN